MSESIVLKHTNGDIWYFELRNISLRLNKETKSIGFMSSTNVERGWIANVKNIQQINCDNKKVHKLIKNFLDDCEYKS